MSYGLGSDCRSQRKKTGLFIFIFSYKTLQHGDPVGQQESSSISNSRQSDYQTPYNRAQIKSASHSGFSQMGQKSLRPPSSTQCQQSRPLPGSVPSANSPFVQTVQPQNSWKFTNSFGSRSSSSEGNRGTNQTQNSMQKKVQVENVQML